MRGAPHSSPRSPPRSAQRIVLSRRRRFLPSLPHRPPGTSLPPLPQCCPPADSQQRPYVPVPPGDRYPATASYDGRSPPFH
eukprot:4486876-Pyramimonas_sp.AAC.1